MRELKSDEIEMVSGGEDHCETVCKMTSTGMVCVTLCWPAPPGGDDQLPPTGP